MEAPERLRRIRAGELAVPAYGPRVAEVFDEPAGYRFDLFGPEEVAADTAALKREAADPELRALWIEPGLGVDPERVWLIGSLGADLPIALDFRTEPPRVLFLAVPGWRVVAEDFDALWERLTAGQ
ncbi:hypothetical protein ACFC6L_03760 [Kitasatospora phosalacinea]|uniref:hypothetical protein n=1 Tax=Kitasatospora phosalacinea TaxID=2065 RepID=UPI0035D52D30